MKSFFGSDLMIDVSSTCATKNRDWSKKMLRFLPNLTTYITVSKRSIASYNCLLYKLCNIFIQVQNEIQVHSEEIEIEKINRPQTESGQNTKTCSNAVKIYFCMCHEFLLK